MSCDSYCGDFLKTGSVRRWDHTDDESLFIELLYSASVSDKTNNFLSYYLELHEEKEKGLEEMFELDIDNAF